MTTEATQEYDESLQAMLELVWGEGYLSPGGPDEVRRVLEGIVLKGKEVLDIGCGTGGIDLLLATEYGAGQVTGIDVDPGLVARCTQRARERGVGNVTYRTVATGPLPFPDACFDVVFSKDAMVHIEDKEAVFKEVFRVLRPGGIFTASDWLSRDDDPMSPELALYVRTEGLDFGLGSAARYRAAMDGAGFTDIRVRDRNAWYRDVARRELDAMQGPLYQRGVELVGKEFFDHEIDVWRTMLVVLDSGELRPTHLRAVRPAGR